MSKATIVIGFLASFGVTLIANFPVCESLSTALCAGLVAKINAFFKRLNRFGQGRLSTS